MHGRIEWDPTAESVEYKFLSSSLSIPSSKQESIELGCMATELLRILLSMALLAIQLAILCFLAGRKLFLPMESPNHLPSQTESETSGDDNDDNNGDDHLNWLLEQGKFMFSMGVGGYVMERSAASALFWFELFVDGLVLITYVLTWKSFRTKGDDLGKIEQFLVLGIFLSIYLSGSTLCYAEILRSFL